MAAFRPTTYGNGRSEPLVPNDPDTHRVRNRRIEPEEPDCVQ